MKPPNRGGDFRTLIRDLGQLYQEQSGLFHQLAIAAGLDPRIDFQQRDLRSLLFTNADLRGYNFYRSNLRGTLLRTAKCVDKTSVFKDAELDTEDRQWLVAQNLPTTEGSSVEVVADDIFTPVETKTFKEASERYSYTVRPEDRLDSEEPSIIQIWDAPGWPVWKRKRNSS